METIVNVVQGVTVNSKMIQYVYEYIRYEWIKKNNNKKICRSGGTLNH